MNDEVLRKHTKKTIGHKHDIVAEFMTDEENPQRKITYIVMFRNLRKQK